MREPRIEADLRHVPGARQIDPVRALQRRRRRREHQHPVRQRDGFLQIVGDEHHGGRRQRPQLQQLVFHQRARLHVQRPERLVHQQDLRFVDQALGQGNPLAHPAAELAGVAVLEPRQPHARDPVARPPARLLPRHPAVDRPGGDVVQHVLPWEDRIGLEHVAGVAADPRNGLAEHEHPAPAGRFEPGDQTQRGRFAGSRRTDDRAELAARHRQREIADRRVERPARRPEPLGDLVQRNRRLPAGLRVHGVPFRRGPDVLP